MTMEESGLLRLATYMCPSIPVEFYELLGAYLEKELKLRSTLLYDSRRMGPDGDRGDHHWIDLAFIPTSSYVNDLNYISRHFSLLPVGAVTRHPKKGDVLGYYTDIVVHRDVKDRAKEFLDLRGCKYAYSTESSISSSKQMARSLKQLGESATFFSDVELSGNHVASIELVMAKRVEAAAVDSLSLANYLNVHYYQEAEVGLQESFGPLPPHPIMINNSIPVALRESIKSALLRMHQSPEWAKQLHGFSINKFQDINTDIYLQAKDLIDSTRSLKNNVTYY